MFVDDDLSQYGPDPFLRALEFKVMIRGFFDDSGKESDPSNRIVSIAGYCAVDSMWGPFHEHWKQVLLKYGMTWLHMKDFMHDQGDCVGRGWDWPQKREILEDFVRAIKVYNLVGFGVAVDMQAWAALPQVVRDDLGEIQLFCFTRLIGMISKRMQTSAPNDYFSIIFDCDTNFTPGRFQRFIKIRETFPDVSKRLTSITIGEPKIFIALQAADFLAWETRKDLLRQVGGYEMRPEMQSLFQMMPSSPPDYKAELWDAGTFPILERAHEQRISKFRQGDAGTCKSSSLEDQGETGRGEGSKEAEES